MFTASATQGNPLVPDVGVELHADSNGSEENLFSLLKAPFFARQPLPAKLSPSDIDYFLHGLLQLSSIVGEIKSNLSVEDPHGNSVLREYLAAHVSQFLVVSFRDSALMHSLAAKSSRDTEADAFVETMAALSQKFLTHWDLALSSTEERAEAEVQRVYWGSLLTVAGRISQLANGLHDGASRLTFRQTLPRRVHAFAQRSDVFPLWAMILFVIWGLVNVAVIVVFVWVMYVWPAVWQPIVITVVSGINIVFYSFALYCLYARSQAALWAGQQASVNCLLGHSASHSARADGPVSPSKCVSTVDFVTPSKGGTPSRHLQLSPAAVNRMLVLIGLAMEEDKLVVSSWNVGARLATGITGGEAIGKPFEAILDPHSATLGAEMIASLDLDHPMGGGATMPEGRLVFTSLIRGKVAVRVVASVAYVDGGPMRMLVGTLLPEEEQAMLLYLSRCGTCSVVQKLHALGVADEQSVDLVVSASWEEVRKRATEAIPHWRLTTPEELVSPLKDSTLPCKVVVHCDKQMPAQLQCDVQDVQRLLVLLVRSVKREDSSVWEKKLGQATPNVFLYHFHSKDLRCEILRICVSVDPGAGVLAISSTPGLRELIARVGSLFRVTRTEAEVYVPMCALYTSEDVGITSGFVSLHPSSLVSTPPIALPVTNGNKGTKTEHSPALPPPPSTGNSEGPATRLMEDKRSGNTSELLSVSGTDLHPARVNRVIDTDAPQTPHNKRDPGSSANAPHANEVSESASRVIVAAVPPVTEVDPPLAGREGLSPTATAVLSNPMTFVIMDKDSEVRTFFGQLSKVGNHRYVMVSGAQSLHGVLTKLRNEVTAAVLSMSTEETFDTAQAFCAEFHAPVVVLVDDASAASPPTLAEDQQTTADPGAKPSIRERLGALAQGPVEDGEGVVYALRKPLVKEDWLNFVVWIAGKARTTETTAASGESGQQTAGQPSTTAASTTFMEGGGTTGYGCEYKKLWTIGAGTGSIVDLVQDTLTGSVAARKTVVLNVDRQLSSVNTEVEIMKRVNGNPYVLSFYRSFLQSPREFCMFFEYCRYGSLRQHVKKLPKKRLRYPHLAMYAHQLLTAVSHLHACGVAHRDIKPANILMFDKNHLKLADFGSATTDPRLAGRAAGGTVQYLAPERLIEMECTKWKPNSMEALFAEDIWSCGLTLLELAGAYPAVLQRSREMPGYMQTYVTLRDEHREVDFEIPLDGPLSQLQPVISNFLRRMLHLNPAARETAAELLMDPFMSAAALSRSEDGFVFTSVGSFQPSMHSRNGFMASTASSVFTASDFVVGDDDDDGWSDDDVHISSVFSPRS